jgi:hypothetical protein
MKSLNRALVLIGAASFVFGLLVATLIATSDHTNSRGAVLGFALVIGWSFIGTGLYAWHRRPNTPIGAMMIGVGLTSFMGQLAASNIPAIYITGEALATLSIAALVHLMCALPDGKVVGRLRIGSVIGAYFLTTIYSFVALFFFIPTADDCANCPSNPIQIWPSTSTFHALEAVQNTLGILIILTLVFIGVRRRRLEDDDRGHKLMVYAARTTLIVFGIELGLAPFGSNSIFSYVGYVVLLVGSPQSPGRSSPACCDRASARPRRLRPRTRGSTRSSPRATRTSGRPAPGSWRRPTPPAASSNVTSMTAPSNTC